MSRKPSRTARPAAAIAPGTDGQENDALLHLEKGRYRDAIHAFKNLLKRERRAEWIEGLASAYAGRALALAGKGMRREAIELWRSRAESCGKPLWEGPYAEWLVDDGRLADVLSHYLKQLDARVDAAAPAALAALEARLAPALLAAEPALINRLPADSALLRQRGAAMAALAAYGAHDAPALEAALASIPYRSPYRDLRLILKALVLRETDAEAARAAILHLPTDGPFERLAAPLRALATSGEQRLHGLAALSPAQQAVALDLMGCPEPLAPMVRELAAAKAEVTPAALFDLVRKHARGLPEAVATRLWQRLAAWATRRGCDNPRIFGSPSLAGQECSTAWAVEIGGDWGHAETHWSDAVDLMAASADADDRLRAALILRHMTKFHTARDGALDEFGEQFLTRSLEFDVYDSDVHIRLIRHWRREENLKRARAGLDSALAHFPDDPGVLMEAVETALAAGAFKKAVATARHLLELDPLNPKIRSLVGNAHLSHAAKQIAAGKLEAAQTEIEDAAAWLGSAVEKGRMLALRAWVEPAGSAERKRLAHEAVTCWGGGPAAGWRLLREADRIFARENPVRLLAEAGIDPAKGLSSADVLVLAQALEEETPRARRKLDPLMHWRKAIEGMANPLAFDAAATIRLCEAFSRHGEHALLERFAEAARRLWPDQSIFAYHAIAARFEKNQRIATDRDFDDLDNAYDRARKEKDRRLATRIDALFDADFPPEAVEPAMPFDAMKPDPKKVRASIEEKINREGAQAFLNEARTILGRAVFNQLEKECAGNRAALLQLVIDLLMGAVTEAAGTSVPVLPPFVPAKRIPRDTSDEGQGKLFDE